MALPTSATWDLADFSGLNLSTLLSLGPSDLTITPSTTPYFGYNDNLTVLFCRSEDTAEASLSFSTPLPSRFTLDLVVRFPQLPDNLGDLSQRRVGLTVADDGGRGFTLFFAVTGMAVSRVDNLGSASALPDTSDLTEEVSAQFHTIRIAVDGGLGRAYVFVGLGATEQPALHLIVPVEATPPSVTDLFRVFVKGTASEPAHMEIMSLRLASDLVIANYPPVANAGPDRVVPVGQAARLDGRSSYDIEGAALTYRWRMVDAPFGSAYSADCSSFATIDDGDADGVTDKITVPVDALPVWLATGDLVVLRNVRYEVLSVNTLTGEITVTSDSIPDDITNPEPGRFLSQSSILDRASETPTVLGDIAGLYRYDLTVNDGEGDSEPAEVLLNVTAARAPFGIEPDVSPLWKAVGDEWRLIEGVGIFEEAWRGVAQILAGKLLEAWQYHYNSSIRDAQTVFQRKWVAYRTMEAETAPDSVTILPRYGLKVATHEYENGDPLVTGLDLTVEYATSDSLDVLASVEVVFAANDLDQAVADISSMLSSAQGFIGTALKAPTFIDSPDHRHTDVCSSIDDGDSNGFTATLSVAPSSLPPWVALGDIVVLRGIRARISFFDNGTGTIEVDAAVFPDDLSNEPYRLYRCCRLAIEAMNYFKLSGTALGVLGLDTDANRLTGSAGIRITDNVYYAGDYVDLGKQGVSRYDLLVLNNGESLRIDRLGSDALDPLPNQRVLVFDVLPLDASATWEIPSVVRSTEVDYEMAGVYPGDLIKIEVFDKVESDTTLSSSLVVAQKGTQLGGALDAVAAAALRDPERWETRFVGVRRRKAIKLPDDVLSVPLLQTKIPVVSSPVYYKENIDYILEPFYREIGGAAIPMLQFSDAVFIDTDTEPPDILWAELTLFSNAGNVEDLFGRLVGFLRDDAASFPTDFNYVAGVAGLLYAQQRGPTLFALQVGAQILLGQPFAEVAGYVEEVRGEYSPLTGRILIRDDDGNVPTESEVVRAYYYKKDPLDPSSQSGLALNPVTGFPWTTGDHVLQFSPLGAGIDVIDLYTNPDWWIPFVRSGNMTEVEKFHRFMVQFNADLVSVANIQLLFALITKIKPTYTSLILSGVRGTEEDLDIDDEVQAAATLHIFDSPGPTLHAFMYDDYRGSGVTASLFDDGHTHYDGVVDNPTDLISIEIMFTWGGGVINEDLPYGPGTIDVTGGQTGIPGSTFTSSLGMTLAAGDYILPYEIKSQGIVYP